MTQLYNWLENSGHWWENVSPVRMQANSCLEEYRTQHVTENLEATVEKVEEPVKRPM